MEVVCGGNSIANSENLTLGKKVFIRQLNWAWGMLLLMPAIVFSQVPQNEVVEDTESSPIEKLGTEYHNGIKLLQNRFRIDYNVEEVTMVFFREYGSAPVVLVQPDGSKIFQSQVDGKDIFWYDSDTYDMISIKNPVPGPWQAVGQILEGSRVMVLSDIKLHADPLPPIIFSGEILKQTAYLTNGNEPIDYSEFRDVVNLAIELISTNNPNFDNFGADNETIATFEDNGRGMDERPLDGIFTGQFNLTVPAGEWKPVFRVVTPMFTREQVDPPLRLYPNPVLIGAELDGGGEGYHKVMIDVDRELVDINTLLVDGKIRFPNGDIQNFSLTEPSDQAREHLVINFEEGIFRVKLTAYGKTVNGRDFILDVPEYQFLAEGNQSEEETIDTEVEVGAGAGQVPDMEATILDEESLSETGSAQEEGIDDDTLMILLIAVNGGIVLVGTIVVGFVLWRRKKANASQKQAPSAASEAPSVKDDDDAANLQEAKSSGVVAKVTGLFKKKPKENES